jgi:hypothetical protein
LWCSSRDYAGILFSKPVPAGKATTAKLRLDMERNPRKTRTCMVVPGAAGENRRRDRKSKFMSW